MHPPANPTPAAENGPATTAKSPSTSPKKPRGRPRKTLDERDDGNRRVELLHAAARLFHEKGFDATRTRDIAAAVGMQSGSPFYHFKTKNALLYAVMEEGMRSALVRQGAVLQAAATGAPDAEAWLRSLVRSHFEVLLGPGSDFIPVMLYESRALTPRQRILLARLQRAYEAVWEPVLQALCASGRLHGPLRLVRLLIFGALNWSVKWFDVRKGASLDDLSDAAIALFLQAPTRSG